MDASEPKRPLPRLFWVFWWGSIVNRLGTLVVPYLTFYLTRERGFSAVDAGLLVALWGLGASLAGVLGGVMADRWGRRPTAVFGLVGGAAMVGLLALARSVPAIAVGVFALGLVAETYRPAVSAAIADIVPPQDRARAFGLQYWAINLGFAVAAVSGGFLARLGYDVLFIVDAASTLLYGALVIYAVPETRPALPAAARKGGPSGAARIVADRPFVFFLVLCLLVGLVFMQSSATMASDMTARHLDEGDYGLVMALNGVLIVLLQPSATAFVTSPTRRADGSITARFAPAHVLSAAALLTGVGFGIYAIGSLAAYAVGVAVWTLGEIVMAPVNASVVAALAPTDLRGRYQGAFTMAHGVASCLGPLIGTRLHDGVGASGIWGACAALGVIAAVGYARLRAPLEARLVVHPAD